MNDSTQAEQKKFIPWADIPKPEDLPLRVQQKMVEISAALIMEQAGIHPEVLKDALRFAREARPETEDDGSNILTIRELLKQLEGKIEIIAVINERRIPLPLTF